MGDQPDFEQNKKLQKEFDKLDVLIMKFDKKHYPVKASPKEIEKLKETYRKEGGKL